MNDCQTKYLTEASRKLQQATGIDFECGVVFAVGHQHCGGDMIEGRPNKSDPLNLL